MMIARLLTLALMPATYLASPTLAKLQDVLDIPMDNKLALAKTKVKVFNQLPVDTQVTLLHWRGKDESTKQKLAWDYVSPSVETVPIDVQFETSVKDWDRWQAEIKFRNFAGSFLTPIFYASVDIAFTNIEYGFLLAGDSINYVNADFQDDAFFSLQGTGFPASAKQINSYFFLYVNNQFDQSVSVEVELLSAKSNDFSQKQKYTQKKGEMSKTPLPYFYESNSNKDFVDLFGFKVSAGNGQSYTSTQNRCELRRSDFQFTLIDNVIVNSTGWAIGYPTIRCSGKWDKRKGAELEL